MVWVLAGPVAAQDLPATYAVSGVAADDVLNIRAAPSAGAPVIGSYAPTRGRVEVIALSEDGRWGRVGLPEGNGWVAMRFLVRESVAGAAIPRPLRCLGTEPFWSVQLGEGGAVYSAPGAEIALTPVTEAVAPEGYLALMADRTGGTWTMLVDRRQCSDGMSDRVFGWQALVFRAGGGNALLSGCCTLDGG